MASSPLRVPVAGYLVETSTASEAVSVAPTLECCRMLQMISSRLADQAAGLGPIDSRLAKLIKHRGVQGDLVRTGDLQSR